MVGPTGVGKTRIGAEVAERLGWEIISADSRQIYKYMNIGTAKPDREMRRRVRFHLISIIRPDEEYSAGRYARDAGSLIERFSRQGKGFILVGGSGLYIRALFRPLFAEPKLPREGREALLGHSTPQLYERLFRLDPETARRLHPHDRQRIVRALEVLLASGRPLPELYQTHPPPRFTPYYIGLSLPRQELYRRIDERFDAMIRQGLIQEVRRLREMGYPRDLYAFNALGYQEIFDYLDGRLTLEAAVARAKVRTHEYARRQLTWFRKEPGVRWVDSSDPNRVVEEVLSLLARFTG